MRFVYSILLLFALGSMMLGCGNAETEPPPGVETQVEDLEIDTGDIVPASEIQDPQSDEPTANDQDQPSEEK